MGAFTVRQSDLKNWMACPLKYRYEKVDMLPRQQSGALTFGTIIHDCVEFLEVHGDVDAAVARFQRLWDDPSLLSPDLEIDYYVRGTSFAKYAQAGVRILQDWWSIIQWDTDLVIAREHQFWVPIGDGHTLTGTADKVCVRFHPKLGRVLLISDYKTTRKEPTYDWLEDDLQFTAYCYASLRPEFWDGLPEGSYALHQGLPRSAEWVQLTGPKRKDAGVRTDVHYRRLEIAVNEMARSVEAGIFVPTLSGDSCRWCEYRANCGLRDLSDE